MHLAGAAKINTVIGMMPLPWFIAVFAAAWTAAALHCGLSMRRRGRRWWVWFIISMLCTVIPATIVSYVDYFRELRRSRQGGSEVERCRHCGELLSGTNLRHVAGQTICAACGMVVGEDLPA